MPTRVIRAVLPEEGVDFRSALKDDAEYDEVPLRRDMPYNGQLIVAQRRPTTPGWVSFVSDASADPLTGIQNQSSGAVLFVPAENRLVAFTFGRGRNLLDPARLEDGFGLRVTLNAVNADRVRAIDSRSFEEGVFHTSRQASRDLELNSFTIDDSRDVLSAVTGVPRDPTFGSRVSGSDGVAISTDVGVADLGALAGRLLELLGADDYKENFGFIDYVRVVKDDDTLTELDAALAAALEGDLSGLSMAPPERVDYEDMAGYRYPGERRGRDDIHPDLDFSDYLAAVGGSTSVEELKREHVRLISAGTEDTARSWTAFSCLVFEPRLGGRAYVLSSGKWFQVDVDFVADVEERLGRIRVVDIALPPALTGEAEGTYNARVAGEVLGVVLLDKVPFKPRGARTTIEIADLAIGNRLVHVKRKTASSTLSHLFAQGRISGETLKADQAVREALLTKLQEEGHPMADLFSAERMPPRSVEVTYVIVASNADELPGALPFFSKLNLVRSREFLEHALDYDVSAAWVVQAE